MPGSLDKEGSFALNGLRILLAEDNEVNQQIASELLASVGVKVDVAGNGGEALALLESAPDGTYDAVLMDLQMPGMDGFEATRRLRAGLRFGTMPIIAMTAHALAEERERCLAAGMNDHVTKPIEPEVLFRTLMEWCPQGEKQPEDRVGPGTDAEIATAIDIAGIDSAAGLRRMGGNLSAYRAVLKQFADRQSGSMQHLRALATSGDIKGIAALAHGIKGVAANLGARALSDAAAEVERIAMGGEIGDAALNALEQRLASVIAAIHVGLPEGGGDDAEQSADSAADAKVQLAALETLLNDADGDTPEFLHRNAQILRRTLGAERFARLQRQVNEFEFAAAQATLKGGE
jgi:two-component system sensor histidine kinase/response regulator